MVSRKKIWCSRRFGFCRLFLPPLFVEMFQSCWRLWCLILLPWHLSLEKHKGSVQCRFFDWYHPMVSVFWCVLRWLHDPFDYDDASICVSENMSVQGKHRQVSFLFFKDCWSLFLLCFLDDSEPCHVSEGSPVISHINSQVPSMVDWLPPTPGIFDRFWKGSLRSTTGWNEVSWNLRPIFEFMIVYDMVCKIS